MLEWTSNKEEEEEHIEQGKAYFNEHKSDAAISEYKKALIINPDSAKAHFGLGLVYHVQEGKLDAAMLEYKAAINIDPNYADAHNNLGVIYHLYFVQGEPV